MAVHRPHGCPGVPGLSCASQELRGAQAGSKHHSVGSSWLSSLPACLTELHGGAAASWHMSPHGPARMEVGREWHGGPCEGQPYPDFPYAGFPAFISTVVPKKRPAGSLLGIPLKCHSLRPSSQVTTLQSVWGITQQNNLNPLQEGRALCLSFDFYLSFKQQAGL